MPSQYGYGMERNVETRGPCFLSYNEVIIDASLCGAYTEGSWRENDIAVGETLGEPGPTKTVSEVGLFRNASMKSCWSPHDICPVEAPRRTDASPEPSYEGRGSVNELTVAEMPSGALGNVADESFSSNTLNELERIGIECDKGPWRAWPAPEAPMPAFDPSAIDGRSVLAYPVWFEKAEKE